MKPKQHTPLLIKLLSLLGETDITEEYVKREGGRDIYGFVAPNGSITINPVPHIVDTLLHELMHKLHPEYSEKAVRSVVGKLTKHMTSEDMEAVYEMYLRRLNRE